MTRFDEVAHRQSLEKLIESRSFCVLSSVSEKGRPNAVGVRYVWDGTTMVVNSHGSSRKVQNVLTRAHTAVCIPARKVPFFPPFCIQFQATAEIHEVDSLLVQDLDARGLLKKIVSAKDLAQPDQVFIRITPIGNMMSYGIGERLLDIARDPQRAGRSIAWK